MFLPVLDIFKIAVCCYEEQEKLFCDNLALGSVHCGVASREWHYNHYKLAAIIALKIKYNSVFNLFDEAEVDDMTYRMIQHDMTHSRIRDPSESQKLNF